MNQLLTLFVAILLVALGDSIYLGITKGNYYAAYEKIQGKEPTLTLNKRIIAILTWLLLAISIAFISVPLARCTEGNLKYLVGFFVGFVIYGIYNGTTYALLNEYPFNLVLADTLWGTLLIGVSTLLII